MRRVGRNVQPACESEVAGFMEASTRIVKDAVCKMELDESQVKESRVQEGRKYYFCSVGCRTEFERHPEDYTEVTQLEDGIKNDV